MAKQASIKHAWSPSSSEAVTPILTPPSPDLNNDDGGALLVGIIEAFQGHSLADTPEPACMVAGKTTKPRKSKAKAKRSDTAGGKAKVDVSKAAIIDSEESHITSTLVRPNPVRPLTVKRSTVINAFNDYFGEISQLANWQRLCADLDIVPLPTSITQCKKVLKSVWVNIYDFLDAKAAGVPVKRFPSERALAKYTVKSGKIFPMKRAKKGGPAKLLLAHIF